MELVHDILDKQLIDPSHDPIGRADGIVLLLSDGHPPRLAYIEAGSTVLARRLHPRFGRWLRALAFRYGLRRGVPTRIPWRKVKKIGIEVECDVKADDTNALAWEHWLREHVVSHIPFSK